MSGSVPIEYRDFWDYPRMFLVRHEGRLYLFDNEFDEAVEDFRSDYKVYLMPELSSEERAGSWVEFPRRAVRYIDAVALESVQFADPRKMTVSEGYLDDLIKEPAHTTSESAP